MSRGVAVVTGASSGIGAATARRLVSEGFDVVAAARRTDRLEALAKETGCRVATLDVTDVGSVAALAELLGECRVLVNNAGGAFGLDPIASASDEDWQRMYDVNVMGTMRVTRALLPSWWTAATASSSTSRRPQDMRPMRAVPVTTRRSTPSVR